MSSEGATDLAGVIGTWVAVFIALVALVGLLPAYIAYKKSRTVTAQVLALVDDASGTFVSRAGWFRFSRRVQVPDLTQIPRLNDIMTKPSTQLWASFQQRSATGWVNFAHLMKAICPSVQSISGHDALHYDPEQTTTSLPVHPCWLLVLGVLHRYAYRQDLGLPIGTAFDNTMDPLAWQKQLSGLSGILYQRARGGNRWIFKCHIISTLKESLLDSPYGERNDIDIETLILLSFGYIKMPNGQLLVHTYVNMETFVTAQPNLAQLGMPPGFRGDQDPMLVVQLKSSLGPLDLGPVQDPLKPPLRQLNIHGHGENWYLEQIRPNDFDANDNLKMEEQGFVRVGPLSQTPPRELWMYRSEVHRLVVAYLEVPTSPKGFLFDTKSDIVTESLTVAPLRTLLDWCKKYVRYLDITDREELRRLETHMGNIIDSNLHLNVGSFSRQAMQEFFYAHQAINRVLDVSSWMVTTAGTLFTCDERFRNQLLDLLEREADQTAHAAVHFDTTKKSISLPGLVDEAPNESNDFDFDFQNALLGMVQPEELLPIAKLSVARTCLACLRAQLRIAMWKMSLSPEGVLRALDSCKQYPNEMFYISSTQTTSPWAPPRHSSTVNTRRRGHADSNEYVPSNGYSHSNAREEDREMDSLSVVSVHSLPSDFDYRSLF